MNTLIVAIITYLIASLYAFLVYAFLSSTKASRDSMPASEKLGISIVLGILLLGIANNYLSFALGALWARSLLLAVPLLCVPLLVIRGGRTGLRGMFHSEWWHGATAVAAVPLFALVIAGRLFFWDSLSQGIFYLDLNWHVVRAGQQAFQMTDRIWPLSPVAFPDHLPHNNLIILT